MDSVTEIRAAEAPARRLVGERAEAALTARSLFTGLSLVLIWTLAVCYMVVYVSTFSYQLLMIMGFGAMLTIFLLHYPRLYLASLAAVLGGYGGNELAVECPRPEAVADRRPAALAAGAGTAGDDRGAAGAAADDQG